MLVKCPECKRDISDTTPSCPGCGYVRSPLTTNNSIIDPVPKKRGVTPLGCALVIVAFIAVPILVGALSGRTHTNNSSAPNSSETIAETPDSSVSPGLATSAPPPSDSSRPWASAPVPWNGQVVDAWINNIAVTDGRTPEVTGDTNLPDGTDIFVILWPGWLPDAQDRLARGMPACAAITCEPFGKELGLEGLVRDGHFEIGPFETDERRTDKYKVDLSVLCQAGTPSAMATTGYKCEHLDGPLVKPEDPGHLDQGYTISLSENVSVQ